MDPIELAELTLEEMDARIEAAKSRMREIDAENADRALTPEATEEFESLRGDVMQLEPAAASVRLRREMVAELAEREDNREPTEPAAPAPFQTARPGAVRTADIFDLSDVRASTPEQMRDELQDRARRAIDVADFPLPHQGVTRESCQEAAENLILRYDDKWGSISRRVVTTGSETYQRAFAKTLAGAGLTAEEDSALKRALSLTGEFGGFAVPYVLDPTVIPVSNSVINPIRDLATVKPITVDTWKGVTSAGVTAAYSAEAAETEEAELKFVQPEVSTERASVLILASFEVSADWQGIQGEVSKLIGESKDVLEATKFLEGSGTNEPFGILTGATEEVQTATTEVFAIADLYTLKGKLPPRWIGDATFLAHPEILDRIRQFDTYGGSALWAQLKEDAPAVLLGKPIRELSTMNSEIKAGKKHLIYGDFDMYLIAERVGMSIEVIPHVMNGKKATGQRGFYAFWRNGAKVLNKAAFRVLKGK